MLHRWTGFCLTLLLAVAPLASALAPPVSAQNGSPIAVVENSASEAPPNADRSDGAVAAAGEDGNTPASPSPSQVFVLPDLYIVFAVVTAGGNTIATPLVPADAPPLPVGLRSDNARIVQIETTATIQYNMLVCLIYDATAFADPGQVALLWFDGDTWIDITDRGNSSVAGATVCGYVPGLGTFAAAEPGSDPTTTPTDIPAPTETATGMPSDTPSPTETATLPPSETPRPTETATLAPSDTPSPTETPTPPPTSTATSAPTETSTALATATATASSTETATPRPTETEFPASTATPSWTPTSTPSDTPPPTATQSETPPATMTESATATATEPPTASSTASTTATHTPSPTPSATVTPTVGTERTQFALANVWVIYNEAPSAGTTSGALLDGTALPPILPPYAAANAWFFSVANSENPSGNKQLCVLFDAASFAHPAAVALLRSRAGAGRR